MSSPPIESRGPRGIHGSPFASLAESLGLTVAEIEAIRDRGELRSLIESNGLPNTGRRDPRLLLRELEAKKAAPVSSRERYKQILARRWPPEVQS